MIPGIFAAGAMGQGGPSGNDPYYSDIGYLILGDGANGGTTFTDSGPNAFTITRTGSSAGGIITSTAQALFGASSIYSPAANSNRLRLPNNALARGAGGPWTWEAALRRSVGGANQVLMDGNNSISNTTGPAIYIDSANKLAVYDGPASANRGGGGTSIPTSAWCWLAVVWDEIELRFYVDCTLDQTVGTFTNTWGSSSQVSLLADQYAPGQGYQGYIEQIRFTRVARYTGASYTPPSAPFPTS